MSPFMICSVHEVFPVAWLLRYTFFPTQMKQQLIGPLRPQPHQLVSRWVKWLCLSYSSLKNFPSAFYLHEMFTNVK